MIDEIPTLRAFMTSLYECDYATFFRSFPNIVDQLATDRCEFKAAGASTRTMAHILYCHYSSGYGAAVRAHC